MDDIFCSLCGNLLTGNETAYGLTSGVIDYNLTGFNMDTDSEWDIYCQNCMNEIERLLFEYRQKRLI